MLTKDKNIFEQSNLLKKIKYSRIFEHAHKNKSQLFTTAKKIIMTEHFELVNI